LLFAIAFAIATSSAIGFAIATSSAIAIATAILRH
jgi:hypothetical protein